MKLIISPAKSLDFESNVPTSSFSQACFLGGFKKFFSYNIFYRNFCKFLLKKVGS